MGGDGTGLWGAVGDTATHCTEACVSAGYDGTGLWSVVGDTATHCTEACVRQATVAGTRQAGDGCHTAARRRTGR